MTLIFWMKLKTQREKNERIHMRTTSALFHVITLNIVNVEIDIFYRETDIATILHAITSLPFAYEFCNNFNIVAYQFYVITNLQRISFL